MLRAAGDREFEDDLGVVRRIEELVGVVLLLGVYWMDESCSSELLSARELLLEFLFLDSMNTISKSVKTIRYMVYSFAYHQEDCPLRRACV